MNINEQSGPQSPLLSSQTGRQSLANWRSRPSQKRALFKKNTLGRRLLLTILPATLFPLLVASGLGYRIIQRQAQEDALELLQQKALLTSEASRLFVEDTLKIPRVISLDPLVSEVVERAEVIVEAERLDDESIRDLEERFKDSKLLTPNQELNTYLATVVEEEELGEIFITDKRGLNLAYSNLTSDFVQRDEDWWLGAKDLKTHVDVPEFDESVGTFALALSHAVIDPSSGEFQGVVKTVIPADVMNERIITYAEASVQGSEILQVLDAQAQSVFVTVTTDGVATGEGQSLEGGETMSKIISRLPAILFNRGDMLGRVDDLIQQEKQVKLLDSEVLETSSGQALSIILEYKGRDYSIFTVPGTRWVSVVSASTSEVNAAGFGLLSVFGSTVVVLGIAIAGLLVALARQLSAPLDALTITAEQATAGNLNVRATPSGTVEIQTLGKGLNQLLQQIQSLLSQQKELTQEQQEQREELETDISQLMEDVGDAADGDLTVRAQLSASDVGIVADLFNAIVENLRDTAIRVKSTTDQVGVALTDNESEIQQFSQQATEEVQSLQETMMAMETMAQSIQSVAERANQASNLTQDTYATVQASSQSMDETVSSIINLRSTVGETAKKIKRLGESAQKISQTVSLIDEIALKTNLLAVNASVEAARAGELGQGFTAVAEQVGALAEQSAQATKDIAQIVADIQMETQEVVAAIETGTAQVVDSSDRVETTKQKLNQVLTKSEEVTQLMGLISESTVEQTQSSTAVTTLMQQATQASEARSHKSSQIAQAIRKTALVAQELQTSVEQFKVTDTASGVEDPSVASALEELTSPDLPKLRSEEAIPSVGAEDGGADELGADPSVPEVSSLEADPANC